MTQTPYQRLGGEAPLRTLVDRFYDLMDESPEAYETRKLHPNDMTESRNKLFKFLSGWLGGPDLYVQEYGHPMLRRRHLPYAIGERERDQWLMCMYQAMEDIGMEEELVEELKVAFFRTGDHMRNQPANEKELPILNVHKP